MIVRAIDDSGDWLFGKGKNDYKSNQDAVAQSIKTRLMSFLGDCFFATNDGIDWWNLLGSKDQLALNLAISATILNTAGVSKLVQLSVNLDDLRQITISYKVLTSFNTLTNLIEEKFAYLLTESGDVLTTETGDEIGV